MAVPDPKDFFDQADKLIAPPTGGKPMQVDLRRAISAAYYGLFHATVAAVADQFVGRTDPLTVQYKRAYKSVEHWRLKALCKDAEMPRLPLIYQRYVRGRYFGQISRRLQRG